MYSKTRVCVIISSILYYYYTVQDVTYRMSIIAEPAHLNHGAPACKSISYSRYQLICNGSLRRQSQSTLLVLWPSVISKSTSTNAKRLSDFVCCEPFRIFQLSVMPEVNCFSIWNGLPNCANHEIGRVRPWLSAVDNNATEMDTRFFPDFATYGFFNTLCGFEETS